MIFTKWLVTSHPNVDVVEGNFKSFFLTFQVENNFRKLFGQFSSVKHERLAYNQKE